jgi:hypothetical protein
MNERLNRLKELTKELLDDSYADQYGIADFVETDKRAKKAIDNLATESAFYQKMLKNIDELNGAF